MSIENFVNELKLLAPSKDEFQKYNVPESYIKEHIERYLFFPRVNAQTNINTNDPILSLLQDYDSSKIGIGNLSFATKAIEYTDYYQIGKVEIDVLALNKITLEIEVRDHDSLSHIIWPCAANSNSFLDALLICARHLRAIFKNPSLDDDSIYVFEVVKSCAEKAGGEKYIDFYKMLLGYFD